MKINRLGFAVAVSAALGIALLLPRPAVAEDAASLLPIPTPHGSRLPTFRWTNATPPRSTATFADSPDGTVCRIAAPDAPATVQYGAYTKRDLSALPDGQIVTASVQVKGDIKAGVGPEMEIDIVGKNGGGDRISVRLPLAKGQAAGVFDWTPLAATFRLPRNTGQIKMVCYLSNSQGTLEWKSVSLALAPATAAVDHKTAAAYKTTAELTAEADTALAARLAEYHTRFGLPPADQIYAPRPALSGPHPRYLFAATPLSTVQARAATPALAPYLSDLLAQASKIAATNPPAVKPNMDVEDPLRGWGDQMATLALAYKLDTDPARKAAYLAATDRWVRAMATWGPPPHDLPNSQFILGLGATYDWLYSDLPTDTRTILRRYLIELARWMRSPENNSAQQWRGREYMANHNWFNYCALAMAATVLWGETDAPLQSGEQKVWMDEAMQNFWMVRTTIGGDGAPIEGYNYEDYGNRPYFQFVTLTEPLVETRTSFLDLPGVRNKPTRLFSLLPGNAGFFCYADSSPTQFGSAWVYRLLASRFKDGKAQLLADIMEQAGRGDEATRLYDPSLPAYATYHSGASATGAEPIIWRAETMIGNSGVRTVAGKVGATGLVTTAWDAPGQTLTQTVAVPQTGNYRLLIKYATAGNPLRSLQIDGATPFREAGAIRFAATGGFSNDRNQWRLLVLGEDTPYQIHLTRGTHTIALTNLGGGGLNFDYLALLPAGATPATVLVAAHDTAPPPPPAPEVRYRDWANLFFYDPTIAPARLADLPLSHESTDMGLYTVRSAWGGPGTTFLGFKCGPASSKTVADVWGPDLANGHVHPDEGTFVFYDGPHAVIPGSGYARTKATTNHNVIVVEGRDRQKGKLVGQLGEGGAWFANNLKYAPALPTVLSVDKQAAYTSYLCDLSGMYLLNDERPRDRKDKTYFAQYRRRLVYLPSGVVIVADRIQTPLPRTFHFRLLTVGKDLAAAPGGDGWNFTINHAPGRIADLSPHPWAKTAAREELPVWPNTDGTTRYVADMTASDQTTAVFVAAIGMRGAEKTIRVQSTDNGIMVTGIPGSGPVIFSWRDDLAVAPIVRPAPAQTARK